jgi:hypothetical protein
MLEACACGGIELWVERVGRAVGLINIVTADFPKGMPSVQSTDGYIIDRQERHRHGTYLYNR